MAALDYAPLQAEARQLIADTGRLVTLEVLSSTPADAARPWRGPAAPAVASSRQAPAVFVPAQGGDLGLMVVSDELLKRAEQVCLVGPAADGFDFAQCTSIQDNGQRWAVQWAQVLRPGGLPLLYALGVTR